MLNSRDLIWSRRGRCRVGGKPVAIADIEVSMFIVGTVRDRVAP